MQLTGDKKPVPILQTRADERNPQVSADGKWLAYSSNESGRSEIYVRPFPEGPGRILVSVNGGVFPRWRRDGRELYFMSLVTLGSMMASEIRVSGASVQREVPRILFQSVFPGGTHAGGQSHAYAVSPDGQRFLIPQFENVAAGFGRGGGAGFNAAIVFAVPAVHGGPPRRDGPQLLVHGSHHRGAQLDADDEAAEIGSLCPSSPAHALVPSKSSRR